jgi:hypothetical protein
VSSHLHGLLCKTRRLQILAGVLQHDTPVVEQCRVSHAAGQSLRPDERRGAAVRVIRRTELFRGHLHTRQARQRRVDASGRRAALLFKSDGTLRRPDGASRIAGTCGGLRFNLKTQRDGI